MVQAGDIFHDVRMLRDVDDARTGDVGTLIEWNGTWVMVEFGPVDDCWTLTTTPDAVEPVAQDAVAA